MTPGNITEDPGSQAIPLEDLLAFIREDSPFGDITSELVIPEIYGQARIIARQAGVVSGLSEAERLFTYYNVNTGILMNDGTRVNSGEILMTLSGPVKAILLVERTALNIIGRMSGISTKTRKFVDIVVAKGARCRIASTRKTAPGLRALDKKAVTVGRRGNPQVFSFRRNTYQRQSSGHRLPARSNRRCTVRVGL